MNRLFKIGALLCVITLALFITAPKVSPSFAPIKGAPKVTTYPEDALKIAVISDIHQLAPELRGENEVFETFLNSGDGKLLSHATEILEALAYTLRTEKPDILLVTGDLTTNGERASHLWLKTYFETIEAAGTQVFVIPGNHDINNPFATDFSSGVQKRVPYISPKDFESIYAQFGYQEAFSKDSSTLSYAVRLSPSLYLIMLDTADYMSNVAFGFPVMESAISKGTLEWLQTLKTEVESQSDTEITFISASHHNVLTHSPVHSRGFVVENAEESMDSLDALGIKLNFTGHIHIQDIIRTPDVGFYEIATGSLLQYPQTFGVLEVQSHESRETPRLEYQTKWVDMAGYATAIKSDDPDLMHFKTFSENAFKASSTNLLGDRLVATHTEAEAAAMIDVFNTLNMHYFAGTDALDKETMLNHPGYALWLDADIPFLTDYIQSMLLDTDDDNHLILE